MRMTLAGLLCALLAAGPVFGQSTSAPPPLMTAEAAARFLDQAAWGPTPSSIAELQQVGIDEWLDAQFSINVSDLPDQAVLNSMAMSNNDLTPVQRAFFVNTLYGPDQLRQRVAFALSEMWVISGVSVPSAYAFPPYWRLLRDNAFTNYAQIIRDLTLNPAMGAYLNMANNNKANAARGTAANENYARELMQLFTMGLTQLNPDGTAVVDTNNNPVPTYTQAIVTQLAKALTGWTYPVAPGGTASASGNNTAWYVGEMYAVAKNHDTTSKAIFGGITIPAGQTAEQDLQSVINALMQQSTVAPFVCTQLIEHLVTSNPSPAYVTRCSNVFSNNGNGVRGDMKAIIRAILTDAEARAYDNPGNIVDPNFGHMREPVLFMANVLRGLNATLGSTSATYSTASKMGQNLFYPPTVFSYFSPLYRLESGLVGPELQIYTTQTAANRADTVNSIIYGKLDNGTSVDLSAFVKAATVSTDNLINLVNSVFLHGAMSPDLNNNARAAVNGATTPTAIAQGVLYMVLTSGEYQIIH